MKLGMAERHEIIVKEAEEYFQHLSHLQIHHVHFERHA
jgi:hypothetical protein